MKNFEKAVDREASRFAFLLEKFPDTYGEIQGRYI